jgi:tetratricopeptide (TPR) repeat protein
MLSRPPFASSPSLSRLLRYLVEETVAGRSAEISEHTLGLRIFNRSADFNPRVDPIVRVQTHYLRAKLTQYYAAAGAQDPIVIELPARTYVPRIPQPEPVAAAPVPDPVAPTHTSRPAVAVGLGTAVVALAAFAFLGGAWHARGANPGPDAAAQDLYSRGRYLLDRQTESSLRESADCFRQAIARDPKFAAAYAGLADSLDDLVQYGFMPPHEGMDQARTAAEHALSLDSHLAEGYVALAAISEAYDWNFKRAETQYRRALELNPQLPAAHLWYGMFLRDQGRLQEAMPELRRAEEMEPMSVLASMNLAYALHMAKQTDAAIDMAKRTAELNPELPMADLLLASIDRAQSNPEDADARLVHALALSTGNAHALSVLACTYARLGRREDSERLLAEIQQIATARYVSPYDLGNVALSLGDTDRAANWLEEAYRERSTGMVFLCREKSDSIMSSLRLRSLVQKIGRG